MNLNLDTSFPDLKRSQNFSGFLTSIKMIITSPYKPCFRWTSSIQGSILFLAK